MIVVDTSVAVKWFVDEEDSALALELLHECLTTGRDIWAPALMPFEVTNTVHKRLRRGMVTAPDEAIRALEAFLRFPIQYHSPSDHGHLHHAALQLATAFDLAAAYDAHYVALAGALEAPLWTADRRLARAFAGSGHDVRLIAEYRSEAAI